MFKIPFDKVLFWDIETAPLEGFNVEHPCFPTWKNKLRKENLDEEALIEQFNTMAGLYAEYSKMVCLSYGYLHEGKAVLKSITGTEKEIVEGFLAVCDKFASSKGTVCFAGHNIVDFDIPYFTKAFSRYYPLFDIPDYLSTLGKKPWEVNNVYDSLKIHKGTSFHFSSMAEVAVMLGLPSPKTDTDGSMVAQLFAVGDLSRIRTYCEGDVYTSICIFMKWAGMALPEIFASSKPTETLPELPLLQKLIATKKLTPTEMKKLKENAAALIGTPEYNNIIKAIRNIIPDFEI